MDIADQMFITNHDWDPHYLRELVTQDFYEFKEHWQSSGLLDMDLVATEEGRYCPLVEDISLANTMLYKTVAQIEEE